MTRLTRVIGSIVIRSATVHERQALLDILQEVQAEHHDPERVIEPPDEGEVEAAFEAIQDELRASLGA